MQPSLSTFFATGTIKAHRSDCRIPRTVPDKLVSRSAHFLSPQPAEISTAEPSRRQARKRHSESTLRSTAEWNTRYGCLLIFEKRDDTLKRCLGAWSVRPNSPAGTGGKDCVTVRARQAAGQDFRERPPRRRLSPPGFVRV